MIQIGLKFFDQNNFNKGNTQISHIIISFNSFHIVSIDKQISLNAYKSEES